MIESLKRGFEAIVDAVMPLRARSARTKERTAEDIPLTPTEHELLGARITTLMDYRNAAVADLIRALKYDRSRYAAKIAADLLADYLREEISSIRAFSTRSIILIPLPLHISRRRERGFNQIELVLESLPQEFKDGTLAIIVKDALERTKATNPQTKLSRKERINNVVGAFTASNTEKIQNAYIFLIDDVTTTGATLLNAGKPLKNFNTEVSLVALARA
ncbi:ComF family protein [Candidatus Parcubacteria bacterium]|nr:MAG: ComF family protein [Candidatus Parcubacteria bacterium]